MDWLVSQDDDKGPSFGMVRADASSAAYDFLQQILVPASSVSDGRIVIKHSAIFALAHLIAGLPDNEVWALCERAENKQPWQPPTASAAGFA